MKCPIERLLSVLLFDVPFIEPGDSLMIDLSFARPFKFTIDRPYATYAENILLPNNNHNNDLSLLFEVLDVENVLTLFTLVMTERPIIIVSSYNYLLTPIKLLLFPFIWQCVYVPICPIQVISILQSPVPFIIGMNNQTFQTVVDMNLLQDSTSIIYIDENRINIKGKPIATFPNADEIKKDLAKVVKKSGIVVGERDLGELGSAFVNYDNSLYVQDSEIKIIFLKIMASLLCGYDECLIPLSLSHNITTTNIFNEKKFILKVPLGYFFILFL